MAFFNFGKPNVDGMNRNNDINGLIEATGYSKDGDVQLAAAGALVGMGERAVEPLCIALGHSNDDVRYYAAESLRAIGDPRGVLPLIGALRDPDESVRRAAIEAFGAIGDTRAIEPLCAAMADTDTEVQAAVIEALERIGAPAVEPLLSLLRSPDHEVRRKVVRTLGRIHDARAVVPLIATIENDPRVREAAAHALDDFDTLPTEVLMDSLRNSNWHVREYAAHALRRFGDERAIDPLAALLGDSWEEVRTAAAASLEYLRETHDRSIDDVEGIQGEHSLHHTDIFTGMTADRHKTIEVEVMDAVADDMTKCPSCGGEVGEGWKRCPSCGTYLHATDRALLKNEQYVSGIAGPALARGIYLTTNRLMLSNTSDFERASLKRGMLVGPVTWSILVESGRIPASYFGLELKPGSIPVLEKDTDIPLMYTDINAITFSRGEAFSTFGTFSSVRIDTKQSRLPIEFGTVPDTPQPTIDLLETFLVVYAGGNCILHVETPNGQHVIGSPKDQHNYLMKVGEQRISILTHFISYVALNGGDEAQFGYARRLCELIGEIGGSQAYEALAEIAQADIDADGYQKIRIGAITGLVYLDDERTAALLQSIRNKKYNGITDTFLDTMEERIAKNLSSLRIYHQDLPINPKIRI